MKKYVLFLSLICILIFSVVPRVSPESSVGLIGYWKMDETSGTIKDFSGNGNDGTAYGGVTYGIPWKWPR